MAVVIDTEQLVAIKDYKTVIDTYLVALQPQSSYWHQKFISSHDQNVIQVKMGLFFLS